LLVLSTYGLVRQIDERNNIWEVSHDFVARLLTTIVTGWKSTITQKVRSWIAPASLVVWIALFLMILPQYFVRRNMQILNALVGRGGTFSVTGGRVSVLLDSDAKEINLTLQQLTRLTNLSELDLSETAVTDVDMAQVQSLKGLESLNLGQTKITNESLTYVGELENLHDLKLGNTLISDEGLAHLDRLVNLEELDLENNRLNGPGLNHLKGLTKLKTLYLGTTSITNSCENILVVVARKMKARLQRDSSPPHLPRNTTDL
jgi:Leucine-rich repeat (LRR) protein